jgi:hypothetical protein
MILHNQTTNSQVAWAIFAQHDQYHKILIPQLNQNQEKHFLKQQVSDPV